LIEDDQVDPELACLSNMSITVIIIPNIKIHPVLMNFILNLFDLKEDEIDEKKYKHTMIAIHGPSITEKSQLVELLSSGYINFIQDYDIMNGFIFVSEFDENNNLICHMSQTLSPAVEPLEDFFHNLGIFFCFLLEREDS
jgi:hypothetical protein